MTQVAKSAGWTVSVESMAHRSALLDIFQTSFRRTAKQLLSIGSCWIRREKPYKPIHPLPKVVGDTGHQKRGGKRWWEDSAPPTRWLVSKEEICMQCCGKLGCSCSSDIYIYIYIFYKYIVTLASYPMSYVLLIVTSVFRFSLKIPHLPGTSKIMEEEFGGSAPLCTAGIREKPAECGAILQELLHMTHPNSVVSHDLQENEPTEHVQNHSLQMSAGFNGYL